MTREVLGLERVHRRQPGSGAPCKIETEVVMTYINGPEIPTKVVSKVKRFVACGTYQLSLTKKSTT